MRPRDFARNVMLSDPPPITRSGIPAAAAEDDLRAAMELRKRHLADKLNETTAAQIADQAELERMELQVRRMELDAKLEELRSKRAAPAAQPQSEILTGVLGMMASEKEALQAQLAEAQKRVFEGMAGQMAQLQAQVEVLRQNGQSAPKSLVEQAQELLAVKEALRTVLPDPVQPSIPDGVRTAREALEFLRLEQAERLRFAEMEFQRAANTEDRELRRAEAEVARKRTEALAKMLEQVGPPFATALAGRFLGGEAGQEIGGALGGGPQIISFACSECHGPIQAPVGQGMVVCPHCKVMLQVRVEGGQQHAAPPPPPALPAPATPAPMSNGANGAAGYDEDGFTPLH